jgi:biotin carboxyl carrier protein
MTFEIEVKGRTRRVSVERTPESGRFRVSLDGVETMVDARRVGEFGVSLLFPNGSHESGAVQLAPGTAPGEIFAHLPGRTVTLVVNGRRSGRRAADIGDTPGEQRVAAPMPGRVVRVLVSPGDQVEARQPLVVVEAMKMENELRSPKAGRIKNVAATAGLSVEAGRVLVVVE